ncbi:MAG: ATP phosphoribosyltransferase regulatory subunit [Candidatus Cloacimonetes bacterium]|nr:ATP phosphoribosyltransferase regulatory subunit [Candidatus Cloacimonadota bacterium]
MNSNLGIHQFMPDKVWKWKILEQKVANVLALHDYQEIRLSVLQDYEVIHQGITALMQEDEVEHATEGIVNLSRPNGDISLLTLRPEGTISVLHHTAQIIKDRDVHRFYYMGPMFRKENSAAPREFHQLGVELLGSDSVISENEVISLGINICQNLGLKDVRLHLNSFGCQVCRPAYVSDMKDYLDKHKDGLCTPCFTKLYTNPFADPGCDNEQCWETITKGPRMLDYLCPKCKKNFSRVKMIQANLAHEYTINPRMFKNFAFYNETVFDFVIRNGGNDLVIVGGGRYDFLSQMITGKKIPAVGFYLNIDSIFDTMDRRGLFTPLDKSFSVYIASQSEDLEMMMLQIAQELHDNDIKTVLSTDKHSIDEDVVLAQKALCELLIVIRDENVREGKILMRNIIKEHQDYIGLHEITDAILLARKSLNNS